MHIRNYLRFVLIVFFAAGPVSLYPQPSMIHLSLGSGLKKGKSAPVTVTWSSENRSGLQNVVFGKKPHPSKSVKARETRYSGGVVYSADLAGLARGRTYYYKCGSDAGGWSRIYSFSTEPRKGGFTVAVIGDTQDNKNNENFVKSAGVLSAVRQHKPDLTLHMGDIVNDGSMTASWEKFLRMSQDLNAESPLMPVLGNHDVNNEKGDNFQKPFKDFYDLFNLPGDEVNYSFTYGNVHFIGIFSGYAQGAEPLGEVKYRPGSPEYTWLDTELTKAENDRVINWIIVWMHYPVNSFGWSNIEVWRANILPLLEKHRVDLCLAGHRHVYERHYQVKEGVPVKNDSGTFSSDDGTIYITNGTAGGTPTGSGGKNLPDMAFTPEKAMYSFGIMDVEPSSITYRVFDQDSSLIDRFIIQK
ncbi:MAG: metallophosphoesterase family protein [Bacteroidales bacterium]